MTMNSSGPISLAGTTAGVSIEIENGGNGTTQISLNDAAVRSLAGVPSGTIIMPTNFYGKSNQFTFTVSANQTNYCLRASAVTGGWNGSSKLIVNINSGVIISSNTTGTAALRIQGSFPGGLTVNNSGTVVGMGGNGGSGGQFNAGGNPGAGGGTAVKVCSPTTFNNTGTLAGGGGGGGGGGSGTDPSVKVGGGGGGGGRSSNAANSSGGGGGGSNYGQFYGIPGSGGTYGGSGSGGSGACYAPCCNSSTYAGNGGNGGGWGSSGSGGGQGTQCGIVPVTSGGGGGGGGKATCGAGTYITWQGTGTRYGSVS